MKKNRFTYAKLMLHFFFMFLPLFANASDGYERGGEFQSYLSESDVYYRKIQPILDRRCTVCHSCFEAPCQLKLTSAEMFLRGATQHPSNGGLFKAAPRTDMMTTLEQQRDGGFFSVAEGGANSLLVNVLVAGNNKADLPQQKHVEQNDLMCVSSSAKFNKLDAKTKKSLGMPYYMAPLHPKEFEELLSWASKGAKLPDEDVVQARGVPRDPKVIQDWENFFNNSSWKARWTSRYLYEHLYTAHFYFDESPGEFYELVRSKTAAPHAIEVIATQRPFEMLAEYTNTFHYRLRKVQATIVHKQHFVYHIKKDTMEELKNQFWNVTWNGTEQSAPFSFKHRNPFVAFEHIPANARYRWMLKNARMLLDMDMRSDNCHGNGATGPLRDSFFNIFIKPESDVAVRYPDFFKEANPFLQMANTGNGNLKMNFSFKENQEKYSAVKNKYQKALLPNGLSFEDIWDGEGETQMPFFTINRHEKNVTVYNGPWGPRHRVSLLWDYVTFERLYYNCVALPTLFDRVNDNVGTVLYLRDVGRELEEQMLSLIPDEMREVVRKEWIQGKGRDHLYDTSKFSLKFNPVIREQMRARGADFDPKNAFNSMIDFLLLKSGKFSNTIIGNHYYPTSVDKPQYALLKELSIFMSKVQNKGEGHQANYFPNISYIIVRGAGDTFTYYTMIANRFYEYINYMPLVNFGKLNPGRDPKRDWMTIFPGIQANYPGKIYMVQENELPQFISEVKKVRNQAGYVAFDRYYGLQKMSPNFWNVIDRLQTNFIQADPIQNGAIDLGDYGVHDLIGSP